MNDADGRDLHSLNLGGSDREIGYFAEVMGSNTNAQSRAERPSKTPQPTRLPCRFEKHEPFYFPIIRRAKCLPSLYKVRLSFGREPMGTRGLAKPSIVAFARTLIALLIAMAILPIASPLAVPEDAPNAAPSVLSRAGFWGIPGAPNSSPTPPTVAAVTVLPVVETDPSHHAGDTADDMAIWIHPTDVSQSLVIGDDKDGGLMVWGLDGKELQYVAGTNYNNLDVRYNFPLVGQFSTGTSHTTVALVSVSDELNRQIDFFKVNPATRRLDPAGSVGLSLEPYGGCMYHSATSGKYYFFFPDRNGITQEWELRDGGNGQVTGTMVRQFDVGGITEGCVADDVLAWLYIGEEDVGIWKYGAEPGDGSTRTQVDRTGSSGNLVADVEGLSIYYAGADAGYLLASSQGESTVVVYTREGSNTLVGEFNVGGNGAIDSSSGSDGLDVTNFPLAGPFQLGLFTIHDDSNSGGTASNVKYVPWASIATALGGLLLNTTWDPRLVGSGAPPPPPPNPQCSDGADNDGDGLIDYPADPGCSSASDNDETNVTPPPPPGAIPVGSFRGLYFDNEDLTNQKLERVDAAINFNWGTGSPDPLIGPDTFSVRWEGYWNLAQAGTYRFTATTDDGMRGWVDNASVIDAWTLQSPTTYTKDVTLAAGQHDVKVEFFEHTATAIAQVSWSFLAASPPGIGSPVSTLSLSGARSVTGWYTTPVSVTLTATGGSGGLTIRYRLDDPAWSTYAGPVEVGEGRHVLEYGAADASGVEEPVRSVAFGVDLTPPVFARAEPTGTVTESTVEIRWEAVDATSGVVGYDVAVDGGPFLPVGTATSLQLTLSDGEHFVAARATDDAGNVAVDVIAFRVDTNPFSLSGPFQGIPTYLLIELLAGLAAYGYLRRRRRRRTMRASPHYR